MLLDKHKTSNRPPHKQWFNNIRFSSHIINTKTKLDLLLILFLKIQGNKYPGYIIFFGPSDITVLSLSKDHRLFRRRHVRSVILFVMAEVTAPTRQICAFSMNKLFEAGKVKPVIGGPYKLDEVPEAFRIFGKGDPKGKIVIAI